MFKFDFTFVLSYYFIAYGHSFSHHHEIIGKVVSMLIVEELFLV